MVKKYFVHVPGRTYAANFYGRNEREARAAARDLLGVSRLPKGTSVWHDKFATDVGLVLSNIPGNYSAQTLETAAAIRKLLDERSVRYR